MPPVIPPAGPPIQPPVPMLVNLPSRVTTTARALPVQPQSLVLLTAQAAQAQQDLDAVIHANDVVQGQLVYVEAVIQRLQDGLN